VLSFDLLEPLTPLQGVVLQIFKIDPHLPDRGKLGTLLSPIDEEDNQQADYSEEDRAIDAICSVKKTGRLMRYVPWSLSISVLRAKLKNKHERAPIHIQAS
jgi:hypothetical protein